MKTIILEGVVVGNGRYNAEVEVDDAALEELQRQGLLRLWQGKPSGDAEKALLEKLFPGKKRSEIEIIDSETGKPRRFTRTDIAYGPEFVEAFTSAYKGAGVTVGEEVIPLNVKSLTFEEYTGSAAVVPKYKAEKDQVRAYLFEADGKTPRLLKSGEPRTAETFATNRGLEAPTEPWEEDTEFLTAVKQWIKEENERRANAE